MPQATDPFLAMEYLQGQTLEARLNEVNQFPPQEIIRIARQMIAGLAAAHAQGLIHRDIKPANVWLEKTNGRVKLLDFGLARPVQSGPHLTQTGNIVGTPEFMSPEQARGEPLDVRSDLFSLGAVLYAMCCGQSPFQGSSVMAILTALAVSTTQPLKELRPDIPPTLSQMIAKLLSKNPADRPARLTRLPPHWTATRHQLHSRNTVPGPCLQRPHWHFLQAAYWRHGSSSVQEMSPGHEGCIPKPLHRCMRP